MQPTMFPNKKRFDLDSMQFTVMIFKGTVYKDKCIEDVAGPFMPKKNNLTGQKRC